MNNWIRQINWYESQLKQIKDLNFDFLKENADLKERNSELESLLYVLTRHPEELQVIRKKLSTAMSDNSEESMG